MTPIKKAFQYGDHNVTLETGEIARQADGAIMINMDDTVVQVTGFIDPEWLVELEADAVIADDKR